MCCSKSECEIRSLTYSTRQLAQVKFENKNEILSILTIQEYPNIAPVLKRKEGGEGSIQMQKQKLSLDNRGSI